MLLHLFSDFIFFFCFFKIKIAMQQIAFTSKIYKAKTQQSNHLEIVIVCLPLFVIPNLRGFGNF